MSIDKIGSSTSSIVANQIQTQSTEAVKAANQAAAKTDSVELSNRNPANKKEIMATYSNLRLQMPSLQRQAIVNAMNGDGSTIDFTAPTVQTKQTLASASSAQTTSSAATTQTKAQNVIPAGNKVIDGDRTQVNITDKTGNTGNVVTGPKGFGNNNNQVNISGANNNVNLAGTPPSGVRPESMALTGGPGINDTTVNVTGSKNIVTATGGLQRGNTFDLNGTGNNIQVGNAVSNAKVKVTGDNVSVNVADNNLLTRNQNNWNVSVAANNVSVKIENGTAVVTGANGASTDNLKIEIDNEKRTVTISQQTDVVKAPVAGEDLGV